MHFLPRLLLETGPKYYDKILMEFTISQEFLFIHSCQTYIFYIPHSCGCKIPKILCWDKVNTSSYHIDTSNSEAAAASSMHFCCTTYKTLSLSFPQIRTRTAEKLNGRTYTTTYAYARCLPASTMSVYLDGCIFTFCSHYIYYQMPIANTCTYEHVSSLQTLA